MAADRSVVACDVTKYSAGYEVLFWLEAEMLLMSDKDKDPVVYNCQESRRRIETNLSVI
jgi:hypothetical protein